MMSKMPPGVVLGTAGAVAVAPVVAVVPKAPIVKRAPGKVITPLATVGVPPAFTYMAVLVPEMTE